MTNKIQPTKELHPIPQTSHPPPTTTHSETGAKSKNKNMMTLKKTKNLTTPSPIRKKKDKRSEIAAKRESEGKKLSQTLLKWLELEKNAQVKWETSITNSSKEGVKCQNTSPKPSRAVTISYQNVRKGGLQNNKNTKKLASGVPPTHQVGLKTLQVRLENTSPQPSRAVKTTTLISEDNNMPGSSCLKTSGDKKINMDSSSITQPSSLPLPEPVKEAAEINQSKANIKNMSDLTRIKTFPSLPADLVRDYQGKRITRPKTE